MALSRGAAAHDIPLDATVQAFVKPSGRHLEPLVRAPLETMRDMDFPERGGYLDTDALAPLLPDAANLWIADFIEVSEDDAIILSALVAHTAWHWMLERADRLRAYRFEWPPLDPAVVARGLGWLALAALLAALFWVAGTFLRQRSRRAVPSRDAAREASGDGL